MASAADEVGKALTCAARALGVKDTFVMRGPAGDNNATAKTVAERFIEIINESKPDVIVTWGPDGLTGHGRHIMVGNVVTRLFQQQAQSLSISRASFTTSRIPNRAFPKRDCP